MFHKNGMVFSGRTSELSGRRTSTFLLLALCFLALLFPGAAFATDPIDLDPDPDLAAPATTIVVDDLESVDVGSLPPGRYILIVLGEDGSTQTYEIWV